MDMKKNRRVCFSPEPTFATNKHGGAAAGGNKNRVIMKIWIFKFPEGARFSVGSFFKKVAKALPPLAAAGRRRCSRKVSSASLARSRSYAETQLDSQRAEAIEDCIEFLNSCSSCSSLQRSNSVSSSC